MYLAKNQGSKDRRLLIENIVLFSWISAAQESNDLSDFLSVHETKLAPVEIHMFFKIMGFLCFHINWCFYLDLFKVICYFVPWEIITIKLSIWKNICFISFQTSKSRKSKIMTIGGL